MITDQAPTLTKVIIASKNVHKIREMKQILSHVKQLDILTLLDFPSYTAPDEVGETFEEIAATKAKDAAKQLQCWAIGEDSGLVVPALKGSPGIYSKRYAGSDATDRDNRKKLLQEMSNLADDDRAAYFMCAMALATPAGELKKLVTATCEGRIVTEEKGGNGFGYDPIFQKYDYNKTFGELEESIKNRISHRRKTLDKLLPFLESLLG